MLSTQYSVLNAQNSILNAQFLVSVPALTLVALSPQTEHLPPILPVPGPALPDLSPPSPLSVT